MKCSSEFGPVRKNRDAVGRASCRSSLRQLLGAKFFGKNLEWARKTKNSLNSVSTCLRVVDTRRIARTPKVQKSVPTSERTPEPYRQKPAVNSQTPSHWVSLRKSLRRRRGLQRTSDASQCWTHFVPLPTCPVSTAGSTGRCNTI